MQGEPVPQRPKRRGLRRNANRLALEFADDLPAMAMQGETNACDHPHGRVQRLGDGLGVKRHHRATLRSRLPFADNQGVAPRRMGPMNAARGISRPIGTSRNDVSLVTRAID